LEQIGIGQRFAGFGDKFCVARALITPEEYRSITLKLMRTIS
jgi:hypothetical protein